MPNEPAQLLTVSEVAAALHLSRGTINRYIASGLIPSVKVGRARRVSRAPLSAFVEKLEREGRVPPTWPHDHRASSPVGASAQRRAAG